MTDKNQYIAGLIGKYLDDSLDANEEKALEAWINAADSNRALFTEMTSPEQLTRHLQQYYAYNSARISARISEQIPAFRETVTPARTLSPLRKWGWAAAAAVLLLAGGTYYRYAYRQPATFVAAAPAIIEPGKQGAILTLSDGRQVVLDSLNNGVVAKQSGASIVMADGQLVYDPTVAGTAAMQYNKMTTPKGRQFRVTLPDGTNVWLNAASSLRYPTSFTGNERRVEVTGEAYFDVVKNAGKPFIVQVKDKADIEVLGTSFNINAYENEQAIRTTLLNGGVRVGVPSTDYKKAVVLTPGQQAQIAGQQITVAVNQPTDKILAWKNGLFNFDGADLEEVMRQLERWYDIEVIYENGIPHTRFIGELSRQIALTDLLDILKRTEVDFRVEGRKLIVLNK
ncbi:FecR domain-containing protein [Chitinophaga oryzae]|uniref:FecR domain-containing protein n=1 Tax=Chitinophaga oryzae TaxID=2725414 RepID=A0ABX6LFQ4_9BACT|nr:FecR family protein [Chitinophaga oryzae]QJB38662.1 FecR domain-containing protein [Chitinophaga oryzae]